MLGVRDLEANVSLFRRAYDWPEPRRPARGRAVFPGCPVALESPVAATAASRGELARRLDALGDSPAAFLIAADDLDAAREHLDLSPPEERAGETIAWLRLDGPAARRLGLIEIIERKQGRQLENTKRL